MPRPPHPHEHLVQELRELLTNMPSTHSISDDSDQYYVDAAGYSPMGRIMEENSQRFRRAKEISEQLVHIGPAAADAVALGLRMQGAWRRYLVPYARAHPNTQVIADAIQLVRERQRDPLKDSL